jgi:hypothetical protein
MEKVTISLGDVELEVGLKLRKFPNGGSWSWFVCPTCSKWVRTLRLHGGGRGLQAVLPAPRLERPGLGRVPQAARGLRIPKLRAMLESPVSLRLKPSTLWGTMERRKRFEAALRRCEYIVAKHELKGK